MTKQEPPVEEQWYPLKLGQTCSDDAASRFYSLRYEFKPASIDTSRRGSLHSSSDNKVTVEYFNNQAGKPKVAFEGNVGDYQELDAVLFFDGQSFRLERMHRAVKSLRHIRMPGESSAAAAANAANAAQKGTGAAEPESPQDTNGVVVERISSVQAAEKSVKKPGGAAVRSEKIEAEVVPVVTKPDPPAGKKKGNKKTSAEPKGPKGKKASPPIPPPSPVDRKREREPSPVNIDDDEVEEASPSKKADVEEEQVEVEEVVEEIEEMSDYEEVDISEDEDADKTGVDQTAATLRAQAAAGLSEAKVTSSSSSSGSGSGSSESGSGSSSSDSGSDEEDSASSADDGDDI